MIMICAQPKNAKMKKNKKIGVGAAIGVAIGSLIGIITNNLALWISIGIAIGAGTAMRKSKKEK
jgi:uncharacterized membrane protein